MIECKARAKINLALHVTGQRADGYHLLDSLVVFAESGDYLTLEKAAGGMPPISLSVSGPFSQALGNAEDNLVFQAAVRLRNAVIDAGGDPDPVSLRLEKHLPLASGIGGGSADAAATLLGLQEFWNTTIDLDPLAHRLGADVVMCLRSAPLRARGTGEHVTPLEMRTPLHLVLVNPGVAVSTPQVFARLKDRNKSPLSDREFRRMPPLGEIGSARNDLQEPALEIFPVIANVLEALGETDARLVRMSGSGATCFAVYDTPGRAAEAARILVQRHPHWWCIATSTTVTDTQ